MFVMKFLDGTPVSQEYQDSVSNLISKAVDAENKVDIDELEVYAYQMHRAEEIASTYSIAAERCN